MLVSRNSAVADQHPENVVEREGEVGRHPCMSRTQGVDGQVVWHLLRSTPEAMKDMLTIYGTTGMLS